MIYEPPITSENLFNILAKVGVFTSNWGSNSLGVDDENDFPNALNPTIISEWNKGKYKGHKN